MKASSRLAHRVAIGETTRTRTARPVALEKPCRNQAIDGTQLLAKQWRWS